MQRSGSQKALLVFSILKIIGAVLLILGAIAAIFATGVLGAGNVNITEAERTQGIAVFSVLSVVLIISAIWGMLCGIFGIRAANDNQKIKIVWVFAIIGIVIDVISLIGTFANGDFANSGAGAIGSMVMSIVIFVLANNIKREAGK